MCTSCCCCCCRRWIGTITNSNPVKTLGNKIFVKRKNMFNFLFYIYCMLLPFPVYVSFIRIATNRVFIAFVAAVISIVPLLFSRFLEFKLFSASSPRHLPLSIFFYSFSLRLIYISSIFPSPSFFFVVFVLSFPRMICF